LLFCVIQVCATKCPRASASSRVRTQAVARMLCRSHPRGALLQIGYGFFSGYAGVSLFNSLCVAAYNAVLFVPIVFFMVDRDVSQATAFAQPQSYMMGSDSTLLTNGTMFVWSLRAVVSALPRAAITTHPVSRTCRCAVLRCTLACLCSGKPWCCSCLASTATSCQARGTTSRSA
ncbi:hypothetical protein EON66_11750, partial [archaeon]